MISVILTLLKWVGFVNKGEVLIFLNDCHVDLNILDVFNHLLPEYFGGTFKLALESNLGQLGLHLFLLCFYSN